MHIVLFFFACHTFFASRSMVDSPKKYTYDAESIHTDPDSFVSVVSVNLWFSKDVEQLFADIEKEHPDVDIFLLQEATGTSEQENAVIHLAKRLGYYAVFTPFINHPNGNVEFGTAIVSRWKLENPQGVILPNEHLIWGSQRMATYAIVQHPHRDIHVMSVHLETIYANWSQDKAREEQISFIFDFIRQQGNQEDWKIVGGDLNSFFEANNQMVEHQIQNHGFFELTNNIPVTFEGLWDMKLDYLFFNRRDVQIETGAITTCSASDHVPLWTRISLESLQIK